jgi:hypothetical protein
MENLALPRIGVSWVGPDIYKKREAYYGVGRKERGQGGEDL